MNCSELSSRLTRLLDLKQPAIGLAFLSQAPENVASYGKEVPSACTFWARAADSVFYAEEGQHANCPIGAMTMGFNPPQTLQMFLEKMCAESYVAPEEAAKIPSVKKEKKGILYGPLKALPEPLDLILMWLSGRQAMLFSEATGSMSWTLSVPATAFGRPACAALAVAFNENRSTLSLGCSGMRTFTEIEDGRVLAVVPWSKADALVDALEKTHASNGAMLEFYRGHKAQFAN